MPPTETSITIPGTKVKLPRWALLAGAAGVAAVLLFIGKKGGASDEYAEDPGTGDEAAGGLDFGSIIDDLINQIPPVLGPILDSPYPRSETISGSPPPVFSPVAAGQTYYGTAGLYQWPTSTSGMAPAPDKGIKPSSSPTPTAVAPKTTTKTAPKTTTTSTKQSKTVAPAPSYPRATAI